jgi:GTP cyclohydrolase II
MSTNPPPESPKKKSNAPQTPTSPQSHIVITTHPQQFGVKPLPINWKEMDPKKRGPVLGTLTDRKIKNCIGTHLGAYSLYRALAIACGGLSDLYKPDFTNTTPVCKIGPHPSWNKIVSLDPWGHEVCTVFKDYFDKGIDVRPTIAVTKAHISIPELRDSVAAGRLTVDGNVMVTSEQVRVTKAAVDPVWHLPGISERLGTDETNLRRIIFEQTGGMFPELVTRYDLEVFLPPIGGITVYIFGDPDFISDPTKKLAVRVHDECNGSDVFGSDICTCRPYLVHGIETCIKTAQEGGAGLIVYYRKEGRALGEVVKYLVYNARKRSEGGDTADQYFSRTKCVAGVEDARLQPLMPDILHWLGVTKIDKFVSMSDDKYDAVTKGGIKIIERVAIPNELIPPDAHVEINAKIYKGYFTTGAQLSMEDLKETKGRDLGEEKKKTKKKK